MRDWLKYGAAVAVYIVIGVFTKRMLTWTHGPLFFIVALEVLPRTLKRLRGAPAVAEIAPAVNSADP